MASCRRAGTKFLDRTKAGDVGGGFIVPYGMAFFIGLVLGKDAAQVGLARLGAAIGLFARAPRQFLLAHGHSGPVRADIHDGHGAAAGLSFPFLPSLGRRSHPLDQALNLPCADPDAARFQQMVFGLLVTGLVGSLQATQARQRGRATHLQPQRRIGRIMPLLFAFMVVVVALQGEGAKDAIDSEAGPPLVMLARLGLVGGINAVGGPLQQESHQCIGRLVNRRAHQHLQLLDRHPVGLGRLEASHQLLDFLILGQEELGRGVFFFEPASRSARVCAATSATYCPIKLWKRS